jgi:hypothetical protein
MEEMEKRSDRHIRDLVAHTAFKGLDANEIVAICTRRSAISLSGATSSASARFSLMVAKATSISRLVLALTISTYHPMADAAAFASLAIVSAMTEFFGLMSAANRVAFGSSWCKRPSRFAVISTFIKVIPVMLPPG